MNTLDTTNETASAWSPYKVETKAFLEAAKLETFSNVIQGLLGGIYQTGKVYVIWGCVDSGGGGGTFNISAGAVFYNGEIFSVDATGSFTPGGGQTAVATISDTADPTADPTNFSDNVAHDIHRIRKVAIAAGTSGSGISDFTSFAASTKITFEYQSASDTLAASYANLTGYSFTTPNDGTTRQYLVMLKTIATLSTSGTTSTAQLELYNNTTTTTLDTCIIGKTPGQSADAYNVGGSLMRILTLGPNVNITVRGQYAGTGAGLINSTFSVVEIR